MLRFFRKSLGSFGGVREGFACLTDPVTRGQFGCSVSLPCGQYLGGVRQPGATRPEVERSQGQAVCGLVGALRDCPARHRDNRLQLTLVRPNRGGDWLDSLVSRGPLPAEASRLIGATSRRTGAASPVIIVPIGDRQSRRTGTHHELIGLPGAGSGRTSPTTIPAVRRLLCRPLLRRTHSPM